MAYVEWLRVRHRLIAFTIVFAILAALIVSPVLFGHVYASGHNELRAGIGTPAPAPSARDALRQQLAHTQIPLGALFGVAAVLCLIFTTTLGTSLNAQHDALNLAFTRPLSRERLALVYFGIDAAAIVACFALASFIVGFLPLALLGILDRVYPDRFAPLMAAFGIATSLMFYGLLQGATAWSRGSTALTVGLAWPVFALAAIPGTPPLGPLVNGLLTVIRFLDPLVYLRNGGYLAFVATDWGGFAATFATVLAIAFAGCALAVLEWRRLKV